MSTTAFRAAALLVALTAACDRAPTSPIKHEPNAAAPALASATSTGAEREVRERVSDFTDALVAYPCGDGYTEDIRLEGKIFERYTIIWNGAGGFHVLVHSMPVGLRGIGLTSGAEYRVTERQHGVFNQGAMGQTTSSYTSLLDVTAPSIGVRAVLVLGGAFVVNANGELVIERPVLRVQCRADAQV